MEHSGLRAESALKQKGISVTMDELKGKKFIASFSGGKDSTLAIYRAINEGLKPFCLATAYKSDAILSWFHGMSAELLQNVSDSLSIPLKLIKTTGDKYNINFEKALKEAADNGAEVCVYGDIDIAGHFEWGNERCANAGLTPYFPLKNEDRKEIVHEFIDDGFSAVIKIVDTTRLPESFLGKMLTRETVAEIEKIGADVCGENGEYHTFVFDGPLFSNKVNYVVKEKIVQDKYAILNIDVR